MSTSRPFAYNTGSTISGTIQLGDLAIGVDPLDYSGGVGGVRWWNGPDEDLGYIGAGVSSPYLNGKIGACYFYTKGLNSSEITQNFNATKSRYGL